MAAAEAFGASVEAPPVTTAMGALIAHITGGHLAAEGEPGPRSFQPMNVNFGLFPEVAVQRPEGVKRWRGPDKTQAKRRAISARALADIAGWASRRAAAA